ncbi:unnamed protein product, partial [Pylaiella littoralis]
RELGVTRSFFCGCAAKIKPWKTSTNEGEDQPKEQQTTGETPTNGEQDQPKEKKKIVPQQGSRLGSFLEAYHPSHPPTTR